MRYDDWAIYGFGQVDVIYDANGVDPAWENAFRPSQVATDPGLYGSDRKTSVSVKQSRLGFKASGEDFETKFDPDLGAGLGGGEELPDVASQMRFMGNWAMARTSAAP